MKTAIGSTTPAQDEVRTLAYLPGPRRLPILGNFYQLRRGRPHQTLEAWCQQYGSYFRVKFGPREMLVVTDPSAIGKVLRHRPEGFRRTRLLEMVLGEIGITGVFASNGETWRRQRNMVAAAFDPRHIKAYFPALARVTERLYRRWSRHAALCTEFNLQADLMRYTVDVVAGLAFGVDINTLESDRETIQTHLNYVFPMLDRRMSAVFKYWRWFKLPADRTLDFHMAEIQRAVAELIAQARARMRLNPSLLESPANLIEAMLVERDAPGTALTDHDVSSNIVTILLAGEDTTANTLAWLIYLVSRDPSVMRQLATETDGVLGDAHWATRLELASSQAYVAACAQETMRLKPVAPILIFEALMPLVIGNVSLPAGAGVMALMRPAPTDERYFKEPELFDPERWLTARDTTRERVSMPFGAGPRICPGRNLALLEISLVTSMLFRNFRIKSLRTPNGEEVKERLTFTMGPSRLLLTLAPRAAPNSIDD